MTTTLTKKKLLGFSIITFFLFFMLASCSSTKNTTKLNSDEIKNMIDSSQFLFVAERVNPLRGRTRFLTTSYDVMVKKDSIACYLPFFGRAFQAPVDPSKGGIEFSSTQFTYDVTSKGDDEWDVLIKPGDYQGVQQLYFKIFDNGSASLNVTNTHRDPISFDGHIERVKEK